jgi:hypothetical protein
VAAEDACTLEITCSAPAAGSTLEVSSTPPVLEASSTSPVLEADSTPPVLELIEAILALPSVNGVVLVVEGSIFPTAGDFRALFTVALSFNTPALVETSGTVKMVAAFDRVNLEGGSLAGDPADAILAAFFGMTSLGDVDREVTQSLPHAASLNGKSVSR